MVVKAFSMFFRRSLNYVDAIFDFSCNPDDPRHGRILVITFLYPVYNPISNLHKCPIQSVHYLKLSTF